MERKVKASTVSKTMIIINKKIIQNKEEYIYILLHTT